MPYKKKLFNGIKSGKVSVMDFSSFFSILLRFHLQCSLVESKERKSQELFSTESKKQSKTPRSYWPGKASDTGPQSLGISGLTNPLEK